MRKVLFISLFLPLIINGCGNSAQSTKKEIIVFHAGSLSVPFQQLKKQYESAHPLVNIQLEAAGSLVCARKITELKKPCDILASADYFVINELLIPDYANWGIRFATNEIVVAYSDKARYSNEINSENWYEILQRDNVIYARSDPDSDPCGYRTVLTFMLAEKYYSKPGMVEKMITKNIDFIRPKEVDLVALIEANTIDYMFQYKSVAIQHGLKYIELPDEINLSNPDMNSIYSSVQIDVNGNKPGEKIKVTGEYINYSMTIPFCSVNKADATDFMAYILSDAGMDIFRKNGQNPIQPFTTQQTEILPSELSRLLPKVQKKYSDE